MAGEWQKRIMPQNEEAEKSVLGAMLIDNKVIPVVAETITADDFYSSRYQKIFEAMVHLNNTGRPVDPVTLKGELIEENVPDEVVSADFIKDLLYAVPTSANAKYYAGLVAENATLRRLIRINEDIANTCYGRTKPLEEILAETEKKVFEVVQRRDSGDFVPISTVVNNALDSISIAARNKGTVTGVPTGFLDLDYMLNGLHPAELILIAARPSMGKTAFVLNIVDYVAVKKKKTVALFSLEMPKELLVNRLFSLESAVDATKLRSGELNEADWENLIEGAGVIGESGLIIDDTSGISPSKLRSKCMKYKLEHGLDLIIIDYLQLMSSSSKRAETRQNEVAEISRALKSIARELSVPIIALSQLSRAVESRENHKPMLSDLRESGAIEQDADVVMFLYREGYYNHDSPRKGITDVIIAKQRNGPIGEVELVWLPTLTKFANKERK